MDTRNKPQVDVNTSYTHCKTRIVTLRDFDLPEAATEEDYRRKYSQILQLRSPQARVLVDAISSITTGIAPPVAFPTETVYGLGADATNRASIAGIFAAKGRPSDNPLIVHVASTEHLERLTGQAIPAIYRTLVDEYWPGPLTILVPLPTNSVFAENVHPGQRTIGFRVPQSHYARFLIAATDRPIAAPSANSSGKPSPTTAQHVVDDLKGKINFILDGGSCDVGVESTVVDGLHDPPLILRPGGVSQDDLIAHGKRYDSAWRNTEIGYKQTHHSQVDPSQENDGNEAPRAPGMKYKHYAPRGRLILFNPSTTLQSLHSTFDKILNSTEISNQQHQEQHHNSSFTSHYAYIQEPLNIAILTSTTWSPFADLPVTFPTQNGITTDHPPSPSSPATSTVTTRSAYFNSHKIHSIGLGTTPRQIAQSLFAALRTCDDLGCHFILAEAPVAGGTDGGMGSHHYDAVIERMQKAASEVVNE